MNPPKATIDRMVAGYVAAAFWTGSLENGEPFDSTDKYDHSSFTRDTIAEVERACVQFVRLAGEVDLEASDLSDEYLGHNLFLTAAGHGVGFWDRGLGDLGDRLTAAACASHYVEGAYECGNNLAIWIEGVDGE